MKNGTTRNQRALIIDDEPAIRKLLRTALKSHQIDVLEAGTAKDGLTQAIAVRPDFILLDLGLPDQDGRIALKTLREWYRRPILVLSVRDSEETIVSALDAGADDYLTKPFHLNELLARVRVAERHYTGDGADTPLQFGKIRIDFGARLVLREGREIRLTATEFDVLTALARHSGRVLTHRQLLREIWGPNSSDHVQYLRVYIGHLRQKLEEDPNNPTLLLTEPGVGYRLASGAS